MSTVKRTYLSRPPALESVRVYRQALRDYSSEELEDIYFHIDLLQEPVRYRLVQIEMERRGLHPGAEVPVSLSPLWIDRLPGFAQARMIRSGYLALCLFVFTAAVMAAMLGLIWLLAVPCQVSGVQASLVYIVLLPIVAAAGLSLGLKAGGWNLRSLAALAAVAASFEVFYLAGGWDAIVRPLFRAGGASGGLFAGW
jgi:hypothetical protein